MNTTDFDPSLLAESSSSTTLAPTPPPPSTLINTTPSKTAATSRPVAPRQSAQSVSSTSFNSPANQSSQKTLEQVLTMTSSPGDLQSALMALLEERNNLVQQNAQLWRIVEKQKASLATASKDLERIRAERERYRRLFEETTASGSGSERERRPTGSRSSTRVHPAVRVISQTHTLMSRHQSDNVAIGGLPTVAAVSPMNFDATFAQRMVLGPPPQPQPLANTNHAPLNPKTPTQSSVSGFQAPPLPPPFPNTYSRTSADTFIDTDDDYSAEGYSSTVYSPAESTSRQGVPMIIRNAPSIPSMNTLVNAGSIQTASLRSSTQADSPSLDSSPIATSPTSLTSTSPPLQPQGATQSQAQPPKMARTQSSQTAKTWPAPRLTQFDLTTAVISVPMSHIRANKRGNEVLSFVIGISLDPSVEREGWKIEKLYSDVLTLDVKVRQWLGRSALKKIARLPDAKIFEDSAPSKVDQRKAMLQAYLQSVLQAPWKNASDMVAFFTSDVISHDRTPVSHPGYKEGYLTKRGKNLGGWKTRYFVLQSPVLEYYESRGGAHLGSIALAGSRIGRQQLQASRDADDENAYRHAFLIIEGKRSPSIVPNRHVLCAESDEERDSWVEMLIRYVVGDHNKPSMETSRTQSRVSPQSRALISSFQEKPQRNRAMFQDEILEGAPLPISQVASDASNAKLFQSAPPPPGPSQQIPIENVAKQLMGYRQPAQEIPLSSSLPSHLDVAIAAAAPGQRSNSKLRHYPDMPVPRRANRASFHPSAAGAPSQFQRYQLAQPQLAPSPYKIKTIGPMDSVLFPSPGYYSSEEDPDANPAPIGNDRERKAKPGRFQGFGRTPGQKPLASTQPEAPVARAVFGIPLQESLTVAQIANLPAIVFRCIEYLEAKRADQEEGIYRLSGSSAVIKNLKDRFNTEGDVNLVESEEYWDSHVVAGLLKSYLRELPSSILTRDLHLLFLAVIGFADPQERVSQLASLISQLPLANYSLLRALTAHLVLIVQNSNVNKMTMRNVGIVFSPTLGIPAGVFSLMLNEFNRVFSFEAETTQLDATPPAATDLALAAPATDVAAGPSPMPKRTLPDPSRRNSRSYNDGHADKLLGLGGRTLKAAEESGEGEDVIEENGSDSEDETDYSVPLGTSPPETPGMAASSQHRLDPPSEPTPHKGHSATVAAARGLQVATSGQHQRSFSGRGQGSGGPGLPQSSRPAGGLSGSPTSRNTSPATPRI
ncbi:hypothetical protein FRC09_012314 [Ceratobasidium sp. 395]|nr:hypothetical protein FRC09_012314 [Ceratobasidium sp. 395]